MFLGDIREILVKPLVSPTNVPSVEARLTLLRQKLDRALGRLHELTEQIAAAHAARDEIEEGGSSLWTVVDRAFDDLVALIPKLRRLLIDMIEVSGRILSAPGVASRPAFALAGREFFDAREELTTLDRLDPLIRQHIANRWMYDRGVQANQTIKRRELIEACVKQTKVRWREAEIALSKYPNHLKNQRGRPKNK
jgi:hypothetical protein